MNLTTLKKINDVNGVVNFSGTDKIFFAGKLESEQAVKELVERYGITTFVDLKKSDEAYGSKNDCLWIRGHNANYFHMPVSDPREDINYAFNEKMRSIIETSEGNVLVYCMSSNRVGYWFGRYLTEVVGLAKDKCLEYAIKVGLNQSTVEKFKQHLGV